MNKALFFISVFIITISCNDDKPINSIPIEISDEPLLIDEYIDTIRYVFLSFDSVITYPAAINNIRFFDGTFYLCDHYQAKLIYQVDKDGSTKELINKLGRGPGEYYSIYGMQIEGEPEKIDIYDGTGRKNLKYTLDGEFIESIEHDILADSYGVLADKVYVFYAPFQYNPSSSMEIKPGVLFYEQGNKAISSLMTTDEELNAHSVSRRNIYVWANNAYLLSTFDNSLIKIKQNSQIEITDLDFGDYNLPQKLRKKELKELINQEYVIAKSNPLITKDYYFFNFIKGNAAQKYEHAIDAWFCIIDLKEKKGRAATTVLNSMDGIHLGIPVGAISHNNTLIYYILPEFLNSLQEYGTNNQMGRNDEVIRHLEAGFPVIQLVTLKTR